MNTDLLMAGAMLAASVFIYATGRWLLPKGVRLRIEPVRRSAAREAALSASSSFESHSPDGDGPYAKRNFANLHACGVAQRGEHQARNLKIVDEHPTAARAGSEPADSLTTLVPCSRSTNGYALNFSQKNKNALSRSVSSK